jgi:hypothetical protein
MTTKRFERLCHKLDIAMLKGKHKLGYDEYRNAGIRIPMLIAVIETILYRQNALPLPTQVRVTKIDDNVGVSFSLSTFTLDSAIDWVMDNLHIYKDKQGSIDA